MLRANPNSSCKVLGRQNKSIVKPWTFQYLFNVCHTIRFHMQTLTLFVMKLQVTRIYMTRKSNLPHNLPHKLPHNLPQ